MQFNLTSDHKPYDNFIGILPKDSAGQRINIARTTDKAASAVGIPNVWASLNRLY